MSVRTSNPETLHDPIGYSHLAVGTGTLVFVAGQVALDPDGNVVGEGDLARHALQSYRNVAAALSSADVPIEHVAKITTFVVDYRFDLLGPIAAAGGPCSATTRRPAPWWGCRPWPDPSTSSRSRPWP